MLTFKPLRPRGTPSVDRSDLSVSRRNCKQTSASEAVSFSLARKVLRELRWLDGDRMVANYDDKADAWFIERVPNAKEADGYKLTVPTKGGPNASGYFRVAVPREQVECVVPKDVGTKHYQFLELVRNVATFVVQE